MGSREEMSYRSATGSNTAKASSSKQVLLSAKRPAQLERSKSPEDQIAEIVVNISDNEGPYQLIIDESILTNKVKRQTKKCKLPLGCLYYYILKK